MSAAMMACLAALPAVGQKGPTANRSLEISAFAGPSGVFTGLGGGRNLSFSGGVDVGFHPYFGLLPAVEIRGLYPVKGGHVDDQRNVLAGLRVEKRFHALRFYGDMLFGRGEINYRNGGYVNPAGTFRYLTSTSNVLSPGAGVSYDLTPHFSVFADAQFQRYKTPTTLSGTLWAKPIALGVTYRLPFLKHGHPY